MNFSEYIDKDGINSSRSVDFYHRRKNSQSRKYTTYTAKSSVAGGIEMKFNPSGLFYNLKRITPDRQQRAKLLIKRIVMKHFEEAVMGTPLWQGTARMNWQLSINGKGMSSFDDTLHDPDLSPGVGYRIPKYFPDAVNNPDARFKFGGDFQGSEGKSTSAVEYLLNKAERNFDNNFTYNSDTDYATVRIFNPTPYLPFLEGADSKLGERYRFNSSDGGQPEAYKKKESDHTYSKQNENWIFRSMQKADQAYTRLMSYDSKFSKSNRQRSLDLVTKGNSAVPKRTVFVNPADDDMPF